MTLLYYCDLLTQRKDCETEVSILCIVVAVFRPVRECSNYRFALLSDNLFNARAYSEVLYQRKGIT